MAASVNKAMLIGNLGKDPEVRFLPNGSGVCHITIATTETWKDSTDTKQEKTEWHRVVFYGQLAEIVGKYLKKGRSVYIEGRITTRKWTDKQNVERYSTEIVASDMRMLGANPDASQEHKAPIHNNPTRPTPSSQADNFDYDQIPF